MIDRSAKAPVYAALAPPFMVLAASLRSSQVPSLALLAAFVLILILFFYRDYRPGAAMLASLVLCQIIFSQYAVRNQGVPGLRLARRECDALMTNIEPVRICKLRRE
jgi:hypothetical protein